MPVFLANKALKHVSCFIQSETFLCQSSSTSLNTNNCYMQFNISLQIDGNGSGTPFMWLAVVSKYMGHWVRKIQCFIVWDKLTEK